MSVIKCKMCGGSLSYEVGSSVCECEYCGTKQTIPDTDDEKRLKLYERANKLRINNEFDKAAGVYESIVAEFQSEAEAYWGLVLCKYGIEYVDDPMTGKKIPTCHRSSFDSIFDDSNFDFVMENADTVARGIYREEAKQIEEIRKGIIEVSSKEEPYDIFICYKETAEDGERTIDSVIAQDVYEELTENGYRVFFSRISLEDKLGQEYEPYIFAALNSAKVMLVFGTQYDYLNAVWVKNEWSRFLQLMESGQKKTLIPCYKNIDAYDMPKEFAKLQAQDMGKVGATQDLIRGINKIFGKTSGSVNSAMESSKVSSVTTPLGYSEEPILKRIRMFLEDEDWDAASTYCEQVLNHNPECALAYVYKLMIGLKVTEQNKLGNLDKTFEHEKNYQKAIRFADENLKAELEGYNRAIIERKKENEYESALNIIKYAKTQDDYVGAKKAFESLGDYKDSKELAADADKLYHDFGMNSIYDGAIGLSKSDSINDLEKALKEFDTILGWKDADERKEALNVKLHEMKYESAIAFMNEANELLEQIKSGKYTDAYTELTNYDKCIEKFTQSAKKFEALREYMDSEEKLTQCDEIANQLKDEYKKKRDIYEKHKKRTVIKCLVACGVIVILVLLYIILVQPYLKNEGAYKNAKKLLENGSYVEADIEFSKIENYKDSKDLSKEAMYRLASKYYEEGEYKDAINVWDEIGDYKDSKTRVTDYFEKEYSDATDALSKKEYAKACEIFKKISGYKDADDRYLESSYEYACKLLEGKEYQSAIVWYQKCINYNDSKERILEAEYDYVLENKDLSDQTHTYLKELVKEKYPGSQKLFDELYTWKVDVLINKGASTVYYADRTNLEYTVVGGEPGVTKKIREVITYPNGEVEKGEWQSVHQGDTLSSYWADGVMQGPEFIGSTLKVEIVDESNKVLGEASIKVLN